MLHPITKWWMECCDVTLVLPVWLHDVSVRSVWGQKMISIWPCQDYLSETSQIHHMLMSWCYSFLRSLWGLRLWCHTVMSIWPQQYVSTGSLRPHGLTSIFDLILMSLWCIIFDIMQCDLLKMSLWCTIWWDHFEMLIWAHHEYCMRSNVHWDFRSNNPKQWSTPT